MNIKKGLILIIIGAVALGMMASSVSADDPEETIREPKTVDIDNSEIPNSSDITIGIDSDDVSWEDQPFWDDPGVAEGDVIIAPNPNTGQDIISHDASNGEKSLSGADATGSLGASVLGMVAGILSSVFILLIMKGH